MKYSHLITICAFALCACSGDTVKNTLGLNRSAPDEFRVVSRPPLSVPPQFNLRPPSDSNDIPAMPPAEKQAKTMLLGHDSALNATTLPTVTTAVDSPESQFLKNAGADKATPNIRAAMEADKQTASEPVEEEKSWWDIFSSTPDKKDPVVDAKKEAGRIQQDKAAGQPVTVGDTPNVPQKDTGLLGRIFGY